MNPYLAFYAYFSLRWISSMLAEPHTAHLRPRRFCTLHGCLGSEATFDEAVDAAEYHLRLRGEPTASSSLQATPLTRRA